MNTQNAPATTKNRLSVRDVCGKLTKPVLPKIIMRVAGICNSLKQGTSTYGDWISLVGAFQAINVETGEVFRGSKLFLPEVALNEILPIMRKDDVNGIEFGFDIGISPSENEKGVGYEYYTVNLGTNDNDPVNDVWNRINNKQPLLTHSKKEIPKIEDHKHVEAVKSKKHA